MRNVYKIAGITVLIESLYERIHRMSVDYLTSEIPEYFIKTTEEDIEKERNLSAQEDRECGREARAFPPDYLETLAVYRLFVEKVTEKDVILFHSTAIEANGKAYLFTAPSGTGKSTHAAIWRRVYGERVRMINDDKPLIRFEGGKATVYGTPWNGKHRLGANIYAPVSGICFLNRGTENRIQRISVGEALPGLLGQTYRPEDPESMATVLKLLVKLSSDVPMWKLWCNMEDSAAKLSYETMTNINK